MIQLGEQTEFSSINLLIFSIMIGSGNNEDSGYQAFPREREGERER
jgi:hypothetical protein